MNLTTDQMIAIAEILAPVVEKGAVEVAKLLVTLKSDLTAEELARSLEESKSKDWPKLTFGLEGK